MRAESCLVTVDDNIDPQCIAADFTYRSNPIDTSTILLLCYRSVVRSQHHSGWLSHTDSPQISVEHIVHWYWWTGSPTTRMCVYRSSIASIAFSAPFSDDSCRIPSNSVSMMSDVRRFPFVRS